MSSRNLPAKCRSGQWNMNDQALLLMNVSLSTFFILSELQEDHSMEVIMRTKEMTVYQRIASFYSAPFTKFMGNLVNALSSFKVQKLWTSIFIGSRHGTVVRALATLQCVPGSILAPVKYELSFLSLLPGFFSWFSSFPLSTKTSTANSISNRIENPHENQLALLKYCNFKLWAGSHIVFHDTLAGVLHSVHLALRLRHHDVLPALWLVPDFRRT